MQHDGFGQPVGGPVLLRLAPGLGYPATAGMAAKNHNAIHLPGDFWHRVRIFQHPQRPGRQRQYGIKKRQDNGHRHTDAHHTPPPQQTKQTGQHQQNIGMRQRFQKDSQGLGQNEKHPANLDNPFRKAQHSRTSRHRWLSDPSGFHPSLKFSSTGANRVCGKHGIGIHWATGVPEAPCSTI